MTQRTAMGKQVDMSALISKNEYTRAVGNMSVNARGDTVDGSGKIISTVNTAVTNQYAQTVGNRAAQANSPAVQEKTFPAVDFGQLTESERALELESDDSLDIEAEKAADLTKKTSGL